QLQRVVDARSAAVEALGEALDLADRAAELQQEGDLILAYQHTIPTQADSVEVYDYEGQLRKFRLDPEKSAVENANQRFHRARHAKERREEVEEQLHRLSQDRAEAESMLRAAESATTVEAVQSLAESARNRKWLHLAARANV